MSQQKAMEIRHTYSIATNKKMLVSFVCTTIFLFLDKEERNSWQKPLLLILMYVS